MFAETVRCGIRLNSSASCGHRIASRKPGGGDQPGGIDLLAAAMVIALIPVTPIGLAGALGFRSPFDVAFDERVREQARDFRDEFREFDRDAELRGAPGRRFEVVDRPVQFEFSKPFDVDDDFVFPDHRFGFARRRLKDAFSDFCRAEFGRRAFGDRLRVGAQAGGDVHADVRQRSALRLAVGFGVHAKVRYPEGRMPAGLRVAFFVGLFDFFSYFGGLFAAWVRGVAGRGKPAFDSESRLRGGRRSGEQRER